MFTTVPSIIAMLEPRMVAVRTQRRCSIMQGSLAHRYHHEIAPRRLAMSVARGYQFFMHPGPTNIPHRVLQAMARPAIDFTGPEFVALRDRSLERMKAVLKTQKGFVITYAASGNGAWDASIANLFSPGEKVLVPQTGFFADRWATTARQYGLEVESVMIPERRAVDPEVVARHLAADKQHAIKAVMLIQK